MYYKSSSNGYCQSPGIKMVKNKRDLKSPRRRSVLSRKNGNVKVGDNGKIKVFVRVRPPTEKEGTNDRVIIRVVNEQMLIFDPEDDDQPFFYHGVQQKGRDLLKKPKKNMQYVFDRVFGFEVNNNDVFQESTEQLIGKLMEGYNCSVFVYGATGAGKTHTMLGNTESPGITFLTMQMLFERREALADDRDFELAVTYIEVYNEVVQDLLNPGTLLHLREDGKFGVIVSGIKMVMIQSAEQLFELLKQGNRNRTQHPTDANAESSRSHAVFQVYLRMTSKLTRQVHLAKLSMIDLAGSERGAATGCVGQRFKEGSNINKSLLALGNCINSLADGKGHVPYRDSKLTRLLKDSLGGNCQTIMIANISPSSLTYEDTYNTLKYATRAMKIKSCVQKNVVRKDINMEQYMIMVDNLKAEVERLNGRLLEAESRTTVSSVSQQCAVSDEDQSKLMKLVDEIREALERLYNLEVAEHSLDLKKQIKKEADTRLHNICIGTPQKIKGHKRLDGHITRIMKQTSSVKDEIYHCREKIRELYKKIDQLLDDIPELKPTGNTEKAKLEKLEVHYKAELEQKKCEKLSSELKCQVDIVQKMNNLLRTCYLQLKGQNQVTESVDVAYKSLMDDLQGIHNVTFEHSALDQTLVMSTDDNRKRKLVEPEPSTCSLDSTFSLSSKTKDPLPARAKQMLSKAGSVPPKKVPKLSPRKENKPVRKPMAIGRLTQRAQQSPSTSQLKPRRPLTAWK